MDLNLTLRDRWRAAENITRIAALPGFGNGWPARLHLEELPARPVKASEAPGGIDRQAFAESVAAARRRAFLALDRIYTLLHFSAQPEGED
jgi:hypothetical protein